MHFMLQPYDESGEAADTGSAVHHAIHRWHETKDAAAAVDAMREALGSFPRADLNDAAALFLQYSGDPSNAEAKIIASEVQIRFSVDPAPEDKTGKPIVFVGRLDQVREVDGQLRIYDPKSSKKPGYALMQQHAYQFFTYAVGATKLLGKPVHPGAVIRLRSYPSNAFFHFTHRLEHALTAIDSLRHIVAQVRNCTPIPSPADWCDWCMARTMDECVPALERAKRSNFATLELVR